jgi:hypothetical protein
MMSRFVIYSPNRWKRFCFPPLSNHGRAGLILLLLTMLAAMGLIHGAGNCALGAQVTLAWDGNTESDVAGYRLHYGTFSGDYEHTLNAGVFTSCIVSGLVEGITYYFAATAYDSQNNESGYSEEVSFTIPSADAGDDDGGDEGGAGEPVTPPGATGTNPDDTNDLAATAGIEASSTDSSSSCFIGTCEMNGWLINFFNRISRESTRSKSAPPR